MMLEAGWGERGTILVVQPRRLAARLLASFTAREFPCLPGEEVGYAVRFESRQSSRTKILFVTDGILERRLIEDTVLKNISAIIFDEIHERRLSGDLCLARALSLQETARPDLGIAAMSATLETETLAAAMGSGCTLLQTSGKTFPVAVSYRPARPERNERGSIAIPPVWEQCARALKKLIELPDCGDVLIFLPGAREIHRTEELLKPLSWMKGRDVFPLHSQLPPDAQNAAVERGENPRVIISTNIAETSLTIEGVRSVIDSGTAREARWDPRRGLSTLHIVPISRAQAEQRTGRAGRLGPGRCIRLWSEAEHARRDAFPQPEIRRADLSAAFLHLLAWGCRGLEDILAFRWIEAPSPEEAARAWNLLRDLGALSPEGGLSATGRRMLQYPLPPVLSRLLIAGEDNSCPLEAAAIAALLQGEPPALKSGLNPALRRDDDFTDFQSEWRAVEKAHEMHYESSACTEWGILGRAARETARSCALLLGVRSFSALPPPDFDGVRSRLVHALLQCFPDHVGIRNNPGGRTARATGGRGGVISGESVAMSGMLFLAAEMVEIGGREVETRFERCTLISRGELETAGELRTEESPAYDRRKRRVLVRRRTLYRDLVIEDREGGDAAPAQAAPLLAEQVVRGELALDQWDGHAEQWIRRLNGLRLWMPELGLPSFDEEDKLVAISMICEGAVGYRDIKKRPVLPTLQEWLSSQQRQALDQYAPAALVLENGRPVKLRYREDSTPFFGIKVQQLFGVRRTPRIAGGSIPVQIEILAPNQRPWQITGDLASFWENGYPQMKKDLAARYPKHAWPDSPDFSPSAG